MSHQQQRSPRLANARQAPNTSAPASAPTPTRLTMALAWIFVFGMLLIALVAIFLVTHAL